MLEAIEEVAVECLCRPFVQHRECASHPSRLGAMTVQDVSRSMLLAPIVDRDPGDETDHDPVEESA